MRTYVTKRTFGSSLDYVVDSINNKLCSTPETKYLIKKHIYYILANNHNIKTIDNNIYIIEYMLR